MSQWSPYPPAQDGRAIGASENPSPAPRTPRRWPLVLVILTVAVVVLVVLAVLIVWWKRDGDLRDARAKWQPPEQSFLPPMSVRPVPGWRTSVTDLGLPGPTPGVADQSRIAMSDNPSDARAFVGYLDDHAYFIASSPGIPTPQWWLIGLDVRDGSRLFPPTALDSAAIAPDCFLNGPTAIFCLRDDGDIRNTVEGGIAWVIDAGTGKVSYTGPTDLRTYPGRHLTVEHVGIYAVARRQDEGVYGVGPKAETTWFVPGAGNVTGSPVDYLAIQTATGRGSDRKLVFSLADGKVITPELAQGAEQQTTEIYPGGFAAEIAIGTDSPAVEFFDLTGKRSSPESIRGSLTGGPDLAVIDLPGDKWAVYTVDGHKLLEVEGQSPGSILVGIRLFVSESDDSRFPVWDQYDLKTGAKGKTCDFAMDRYLGSDGSVGVFAVRNPQVGLVAKARDLATCDTLWELPSQVGSLAQVWRINTTLVQLSDDGTELFSLVPPS